MENSKKIFGLELISKQVNELLFPQVRFKNEPEKWKWKPAKPEKIAQLEDIVAQEKASVNFTCMTNYTPTQVKQKVVLVFAIGNLTYGLINQLENHHIKYFFLDYTQFIALQGSIEITLDNLKQRKILVIGGASLDLEDVSAVVWSPPKYIKPLFDFNHIPIEDGRAEFMFKKRWIQFLKDLPLLLNKDVEWLPGSPLNGSQEWQNKLGEYSLASELGLLIPPTIFTNNVNLLNDFCINNGKDLVLREFSTPPFSFPPIRINFDKLKIENFENSPVCFQKYIEKDYELRVIVLFDQIFPCKIYSQDSELAKNDWRVYDDENVKWELVELPAELKNKLLLISRKLQLSWCSIDLIYGEDKQYYFLEANRPGSHYWLDAFIGLDITEKITNEIIKRNLVEVN